jgi:S1-C subfamily serine protease
MAMRLQRQARRSTLGLLACLASLVAAAFAAVLVPAAALAADLPTVVAVAKPSVLPVGSYSATGNPRFAFRGSGFVIEGNLLATNYHVLPDSADTDPNVQLAIAVSRVNAAGDLQIRMARVVATDRLRDLALLQFDGPPLPSLTLAEAGTAREGQSIALMGFPMGGTLGYAMVTHRGIIAAITTVALPAPTAKQLDARALVRLREGNFEVLQLDATAYPGNSGGPVIDADSGRVMGIVNQVLVRGSRESAMSAPSGITYAIPVALVQELLREYRSTQPKK